MENDVAKRYAELGRKFKLPDFGSLAEFEVSCIEECDFLLARLREQMVDRLQSAIDFLSEILQPDTTLANMYESRVFSESDKRDVFEVFRRLMFWRREALRVYLKNDDSSNAVFVSAFVQEWKGLKLKLLEIAGKAKDSWESDSEQSEKLGYFG
ncbi:hypothetical protein HYU12_01170 [Candidatus Woesearchaeota archaeon]|nr:hypothetical protein [Candidatus Woesearchaeota archaeon]